MARRSAAVLALLGTLAGCVVLTAPATAAPVITVGSDGRTAPVFDLDQATRQRVFIPQPGIDQDGDGQADKIAIEIIRPLESGPSMKVPAIIDPSPYYTTLCRGNEGECIADVDGDGLNDKWPMFLDNYFVPRGYAVIYAESNGTGNSSGCPLHGGPGDVAGMKSVVDWLNGRVAGQDKNGAPVTATWHNGSSGMIGKSYDGTLANAVAATGVDGLKAVVPQAAISDWYGYSRVNGVRKNGAGTHYPSNLSSLVTNADRRTTPCGPTRTTMDSADGDATGDRNVFWEARNYLPEVGNVDAAVLLVHGLQDDNVTTEQFANWWAGLAAAGVPRKLWLLREGHVDPFDSRRAEWVDTLHRWWDHWLLNVDNGIMAEPRVDIEDDKDVWNTYADWPVPGTQPTNVFLQGTAAASAGAMGLSSGGNVDTLSFTDSSGQAETTMMSAPTGSQASRRVFLSPPLTRDLRISGTPHVELEASLSKTQSNLGALIVDYSPTPTTHISRSGDGTSDSTTRTCWGQSSTRTDGGGNLIDHDACYLEVNKVPTNVTQWRVTRGILDSSNRLSLTTPTLATIGEPTSFNFPLRPDDYVIKAGHQFAVTVVANYNAVGTNGTTATTVTLDAKLSRVVLPIVGGYPAAVASGAFTRDTIAPAQTVPNDVVAPASAADGATVTYPSPGVSDNEDPNPTASCAPASGSRFPIGTTTVTCTARDATGNTTPGTFTVRVTDDAGQYTPQGEIPPPPAPDGGDGTVKPPPAPGGNGSSDGSGAIPPTLDTDNVAPSFSGLKFGVALRSVRVKFKLSEAATVTVTITKRGSRKTLKRVKTKLATGSRTVTLRSSKLRRGTYTVKLEAVDAGRNARRVTTTVKIKR